MFKDALTAEAKTAYNGHRGDLMQGLFFFLTVFCGIFGAYILIGIIYNAVISLLGKGRSSNGGKYGRNNNDNRHGRGNSL